MPQQRPNPFLVGQQSSRPNPFLTAGVPVEPVAPQPIAPHVNDPHDPVAPEPPSLWQKVKGMFFDDTPNAPTVGPNPENLASLARLGEQVAPGYLDQFGADYKGPQHGFRATPETAPGTPATVLPRALSTGLGAASELLRTTRAVGDAAGVDIYDSPLSETLGVERPETKGSIEQYARERGRPGYVALGEMGATLGEYMVGGELLGVGKAAGAATKAIPGLGRLAGTAAGRALAPVGRAAADAAVMSPIDRVTTAAGPEYSSSGGAAALLDTEPGQRFEGWLKQNGVAPTLVRSAVTALGADPDNLQASLQAIADDPSKRAWFETKVGFGMDALLRSGAGAVRGGARGTAAAVRGGREALSPGSIAADALNAAPLTGSPSGLPRAAAPVTRDARLAGRAAEGQRFRGTEPLPNTPRTIEPGVVEGLVTPPKTADELLLDEPRSGVEQAKIEDRLPTTRALPGPDQAAGPKLRGRVYTEPPVLPTPPPADLLAPEVMPKAAPLPKIVPERLPQFADMTDEQVMDKWAQYQRGLGKTAHDAEISYLNDAGRSAGTEYVGPRERFSGTQDVTSGLKPNDRGMKARGRNTQANTRVGDIEHELKARGIDPSTDPYLGVGRGDVLEGNKDLVGTGGKALQSMPDDSLEEEIRRSLDAYMANRELPDNAERMAILYAESQRPGRKINPDVFGAADSELMAAIARTGIGAVGGAAVDKEHPVRGAAIGATLLGAGPPVVRAFREDAARGAAEALRESRRPSLDLPPLLKGEDQAAIDKILAARELEARTAYPSGDYGGPERRATPRLESQMPLEGDIPPVRERGLRGRPDESGAILNPMELMGEDAKAGARMLGRIGVGSTAGGLAGAADPNDNLSVGQGIVAGGALGVAAPAIAKRLKAMGKEGHLVNPSEYRGLHQAPGREGGAPLHDLTRDIYPDDVYSHNAVQYYGTGEPAMDRASFNIAQRLKGRPNAVVTIYRAVPAEKTVAQRLAKAERQKAQYMARNIVPLEWGGSRTSLGDGQGFYDWVTKEIETLKATPEIKQDKIKINEGDWVTINRQYAKDHGESALRGNYKILSKKVYARDIFTDGNSIHEWGYEPQPRVEPKLRGPEGGFTVPEMAPLARVGVGAVVGGAAASQEGGLTPAGGALAGAVAFGAGPAVLRGLRGSGEAIAKGTKGLIGREFRVRGDLPQPVFDAKLVKDAWRSSQETTIRFLNRDFQAAVEGAYGKAYAKLPEAEVSKINAVLKGGASPETLPEGMRQSVQAMRDHVDALSREMIESGAVEGKLAVQVGDNMGTYLNRSYQVFDDPKWAEKVPEAVRNRAKAFVRAEYPRSTPEEIDGLLNELLYKHAKPDDSPISALASGKLGSKALGIFEKRKDIPDEIRALWGEYNDPMVNYAKSVAKMSNIIANQNFLTTIKAEGLGSFFHEGPIVRDGVSYHQKIAADASKVMAPLNGLYTSPEIARAFEDALEPARLGPWMRLYMKANTTVKIGKTVGSVVTQVRNLTSNPMIELANGNMRLLNVPKAVGAVAGQVSGSAESIVGKLAEIAGSDTDFRALYTDLQRLGVVDESANAGELRDLLLDAGMREGRIEDAFADPTSGFFRKGAQLAGDVYRANDDLFKIYAYEGEMARYRNALPNATEAELQQRVAKIVTDTRPTYSRVPKVVKRLRRVPLVGNFVSFPSEIMRTSHNILKLAASELADPALRGIGAQRLAGIIAAGTVVGGAATMSRYVTGVTKDEDEDLRNFVAPWTKNANLLHLGKTEDGVYRTIDLSYTDPYSYLRKPVIALMRGDNWAESMKDAAVEVFSPFLSEEILASTIANVRSNQKDGQGSGRIYNPEDPGEKQVTDIVAYVATRVEPGTISSFQRINAGLKGTVTRSGRSYDANAEIKAMLTGQRITDVNVPQSLFFRALELHDRLRNAGQTYTSQLGNVGTIKDDQIGTSYEQAHHTRAEIYAEATKVARAARRLGMDNKAITAALRQAGFSLADVQAIAGGTSRFYEPSSSYIKDLKEKFKSTGMTDAEADAEIRRRIDLTTKAVGKLKGGTR